MNINDILINPSIENIFKETLTPKEIQEDLRVLRHAMDYGYPIRWHMGDEAYFQVMESVSEKFKDIDGMTSKDFCHDLSDQLFALPDGHMRVVLDGETMGREVHSSIRKPTTGNNLAGEKAWKVILPEDKKFATLAISYFPQHTEKDWDGFLESYQEITNYENLIVDLRGNSGGDDSKAIDFVSLLLGRELEFTWLEEVVCESPESFAMQVNTYRRIIAMRESNGMEVSQAIRDKEAALLESAKSTPAFSDKSKVVVSEDYEGSLELGNDAYKGKVFVLIDGKTSSSGEWTSIYMKRFPNCTVVGGPTYGMIHFGNTGYVQLPNSGAFITLCMKINRLTDGNFYEKTGFPPDVSVDDQDSYQYVINNLIE